MALSDHVIERLHIIWGEGFLSPGGPEEVCEIVSGLDLKDKLVLDVGCGTAGPALVLVRDLGAGGVIGIDVDARLLKRAARHIEEASLGEKVRLRLVKPGPLPFSDGSFDVVFSKDSILHIADKAQMFREVARVLKPGGVFAASDWLAHEHATGMPEFARFVELRGIKTQMATAPEMTSLMRLAGLEKVSARDRTAWFAGLASRQADDIEGQLKGRLTALLGEAKYRNWARLRRACAAAAQAGALRPAHLRGHRLSP